MQAIAITGGIGSGKSHICHRLEQLGYPVFYCDPVAKELIRHDPQVRHRLTALVGSDLYDASGRLVKSVLAKWLCLGHEHAARVDAIVHPCVADKFQEWTAARRAEGHERAFMECALLFESGFNRLVDRTALVLASEETRIRRVMARDSLTRNEALRWMALQMPEEEKRRRADLLVCNEEGTEPDLSPLLPS